MIDDREKSFVSTIVPERDLGLYISDGWERDDRPELPVAPIDTVRVRRVLPTRYLIGAESSHDVSTWLG